MWRRAEDAVVAGDMRSLERLLEEHGQLLRSEHPESSWLGGLTPNYSSPDARTIIASNHEFESWEQFAGFAEALKDRNSAVAQFEAAADAIVTGDVTTLERLLRQNRDLIRARSTRRHHSTLLHYIGANGIEGWRQRTPTNAVDVARVLLNAGAEVDAEADMYGGGATTLGLVATSIHPWRAGVLDELIAILVDHGAAIDEPHAGKASPNIVNGCIANGRPLGAELLARRGARLDLEGAAGVGRLDLVKRFFNADGTLTENATQVQMKDGFTWACEYGHDSVVEFLLENGMDVGARVRHHGQTGLHWAAGGGHIETVKVLLKHGAPVDAEDEAWDATPVAWALYGWTNNTTPGTAPERYYEVVALLIAAGATVDPQWSADERVRDDPHMLAALGLTPHPPPDASPKADTGQT